MSLAKNKVISILIIFIFIFHVIVPDASACWWKGLPRKSPEIIGTPSGQGGFNDGKPNQPDDIADEVYLHSGDFVYQHQDLSIPSRGINLEITRTYKAQSRINGRFGLGWELNYNKRIIPLSNGSLFYLDGEGRRLHFSYVDGTNYLSPPEVFDKLVQNEDGTYTLTKKDGTKYNFSQNGTLSEIIDRNNNKLIFSYDPQGKLPIIGVPLYTSDPITPRLIAYQFMLTKITDTTGREISFTYDTNGRLIKITDFTGKEITYSYDDLGHLTSVTDPAGNVIQYTYDADRNLRSIIDPNGNTFLTNTYNSLDQVIAQIYGDGTFYFSYDTENRVTNFTDRKGYAWTYYFDNNGNPTKILDHQKNETIKTYDTDNKMLLTSITYPKGNSVSYEYDDRGNLTKIIRKPTPDSTEADIITTFTYEPNFNHIKTITDPNGNITTYACDYELDPEDPLYGENGNLVKITYPSAGGGTIQTAFTYNSYGQVDTVIDPNGIITKYEYYPDTGYIKKIINAYGTADQASTQMAYDAVGNVTSITDPRENTTTFEYNDLNQLTKTVSPTPFNYQTKYTYDANGNLIMVDRETGVPLNPWQTTAYVYTILDKLETITDDSGNVTTFGYDANDNRVSIIDAEDNGTVYQYNERNLLWKVTDALGNITRYSYDKNGNLNQIADAKGNTTTYTYDDFDRLIKTTYTDSSYEEYSYDANSNLISKRTRKAETITYTYDELNRLSQKITPQATISYTYDESSKLKTVTDFNGTISYTHDGLNRVTAVSYPGDKTISYEYDSNGNRTMLIYPDNSSITYHYDELNRLTSIEDQASSIIASYSYDTLSRRTQVDYANNTMATCQYDAINRLKTLTNTYSPTPNTYTYTYDAVGNRLTKTDSSGIESYTYDTIYRLTKVTYPDTTTTSYNYDEVGNRASTVNGGTISYTSNNLNQYTSVGGTSYTYDLNGNLSSDGTNTYSYDSENRLVSATDGTTTSSYTYDPFGRRISKTVDGVTTKFLYDGDQVICEYDDTGILVAKYIYGAGIDEVMTMQRGGETYHYHFDGLGSVTNITDSSGTVAEKYTYDVYGNIVIKDKDDNTLTESAIGNPYAFTGRRFDDETGLYHYRARAYDPRIGRFLQRDLKTWQPNDPRILQKNKDLSEFFEAVFIIYPNLKYDTNNKKILKGKKAIIQKFKPDAIKNYYSEEIIDEQLVRIFTQIQGQSYPKFLHPYSYSFDNPVNHVDPNGEVADWAVWIMIAAWLAGQIRYAIWAMKGPVGKLAPEIPGPAIPPVEVPPPAPVPVGF